MRDERDLKPPEENVIVEFASDFFALENNCLRYNLLKETYDHWRDLTGYRLAANYDAFNLIDLDYRLIPNSAVVNVIDNGADFVYRFWGTNLVRVSQIEITGKSIYDLKPESLSVAATRAYQKVMNARVPLVTTIELHNVYSILARTVTLRLPMSTDGNSIDVIYSAIVMDDLDEALIEKASKRLID